MFKVDLHTHSIASPDGGISTDQYRAALSSGKLDCIAITDHNRIDYALETQDQLGEQIIVGEEIMTTQGEIIGLFLTQKVEPGLTAVETVQQIKSQGGLVYIPHPFETVRHGLHPEVIESLDAQIDIIEVANGRAFFQNRSSQAVVWAKLNNIVGAASSDAHGAKGLGRTYSQLSNMPGSDNLVDLLRGASLIVARPGTVSLLYPKMNRFRKRIAKK